MRPTIRCLLAGATVVVLSALLSSCTRDGDSRSAGGQDPTIPFRVEGTLQFVRQNRPFLSIDIEVADSDSARMRGMMQRTGFPERSGMLFIFPFEDTQTFWMANTPVALDMIFADADSEIVSIEKYTRPLSADNVVSDEPARFVLEVPAGFVDSYGIVESDRLRWEVVRE